MSPQPCSSRDLSRSEFPDKESDQNEHDVSDGGDDITLEDLVAMETMEDDICEEDNFYPVPVAFNLDLRHFQIM